MSKEDNSKEIVLKSSDLKDINGLLVQLSDNPRKLTDEDFRRLKRQSNFFIWFVRNRHDCIVAMASLIIYETLSKKVGVFHDIVVDAEHRGKGLAKNLLLAFIDFAKSRDLDCIQLTSRPSREAANKLYISLGFKKRETNCYRLNLRT